MSARWSLRSKLCIAVVAAFLPALGLAAWDAQEGLRKIEVRRAAALELTAELAMTRHRAMIAGTQRLLSAACSDTAVAASAGPDAPPTEIAACNAYLGGILKLFPSDYSGALVTDSRGIARCATSAAAVGTDFSDRAVFSRVRDTKTLAVGGPIVSRLTSFATIPAAMPILRDGDFRGMCAIGISLEKFTDTVAAMASQEGATVALIDRSGISLGSNAGMAGNLPVATRLAAELAAGRALFKEVAQDGSRYEYAIRPLADSNLFIVAAVPVEEGLLFVIRASGSLGFLLLALVVSLTAVWFGANRWCVRPLRYIQDFAAKVSRGEMLDFAPPRPWTPELRSVGEGVTAMAAAIANRETELRAAIEQRDHMLREIHHRVKNNLQMISSLLNLQAGEIRSPRIRRHFLDAQNRVLSLSILHRHLYERSSWALVDFQSFISDLVRQMSVAGSRDGTPSPRFHIRAPTIAVSPDIAIPVGLIITEAVSGALRHDFGGVATPEVRIEATESDGEVTFVIEDNGRDPRESPDRTGGRGVFGFTLIRGLAMQLGGSAAATAHDGGGTRIVFSFPTPAEQVADA